MTEEDLRRAFSQVANEIVGPRKVYDEKTGARIEGGCVTLNGVRLFNTLTLLDRPLYPLCEVTEVKRFARASAERDDVQITTAKGELLWLRLRGEKADEFCADVAAVREGVRSLLALEELSEPRVSGTREELQRLTAAGVSTLHEAFKKVANEIVGPSKKYSSGLWIRDGCVAGPAGWQGWLSVELSISEIAEVRRLRGRVRINTKGGGKLSHGVRNDKVGEFFADIRAIRQGVRSTLGLEVLTEPRVYDEPPAGLRELWAGALARARGTVHSAQNLTEQLPDRLPAPPVGRGAPAALPELPNRLATIAAEVVADCGTWAWATWVTTSVALLAAAFGMVFLAKYSGWGLPHVLATWALVGGYVQAVLPYLQSARRRGWLRPWVARRVPGSLLLLLAGFWMARLGYLWDDPAIGGLGVLGIAAGILAPGFPHEKGD